MRLPPLVAVFLLAAAVAPCQSKQAMDEEYARLVKEWTTAPEFMSPLVDHLPKAQGVPTTKDVLGYYAGAPKKLTKVAELGQVLPGAGCRVEAGEAASRPAPRMKAASAWWLRSPTKRSFAIWIRTRVISRGWPIREDSPRGSGEADHRPGEADLHVYRRTALRRNRAAGDADGTGLPAGRGGGPLFDSIRKNVIVMLIGRGRARWARPLRRLVLQVQAGRRERERSHARAPVLGQVYFPRQQPRHQLLAGDHVQLVEVLLGVASADHARPA